MRRLKLYWQIALQIQIFLQLIHGKTISWFNLKSEMALKNAQVTRMNTCNRLYSSISSSWFLRLYSDYRYPCLQIMYLDEKLNNSNLYFAKYYIHGSWIYPYFSRWQATILIINRLTKMHKIQDVAKHTFHLFYIGSIYLSIYLNLKKVKVQKHAMSMNLITWSRVNGYNHRYIKCMIGLYSAMR